MQGTIAKPVVSIPIGLSPRLRTCAVRHLPVFANCAFPVKTTLPCLKMETKAHGIRVQALNTPFMSMTRACNSRNSPDKKRIQIPNASKYPPKGEKPKWWLRALAGLPYLLPFFDHHLSWTLAHPANPPPFLENFDNFIFPLISTFVSLPRFLLATYPLILYFWIVRRKEWPNFLRFHVMMGILLGTLVQVIGVSGNWFPARAYPPYFWSIATLLFLISILECIRCALFGKYAGLPFVKDAAFLHSDLNIR